MDRPAKRATVTLNKVQGTVQRQQGPLGTWPTYYSMYKRNLCVWEEGTVPRLQTDPHSCKRLGPNVCLFCKPTHEHNNNNKTPNHFLIYEDGSHHCKCVVKELSASMFAVSPPRRKSHFLVQKLTSKVLPSGSVYCTFSVSRASSFWGLMDKQQALYGVKRQHVRQLGWILGIICDREYQQALPLWSPNKPAVLLALPHANVYHAINASCIRYGQSLIRSPFQNCYVLNHSTVAQEHKIFELCCTTLSITVLVCLSHTIS